MPSPETCRQISGPLGPGVYQVRNKISAQFILFGIGVRCHKRMKSLYPAPYGTGKRNNKEKRAYVLANWQSLEFRTISTETRPDAKAIEDKIREKRDHLFNELRMAKPLKV